MSRLTRLAQPEAALEQVSEVLGGATAFFVAAAIYVAFALAL